MPKPTTMYSSSTGVFREELDRWRARMEVAKKKRDRNEQRRLAILVETIAGRWLEGENHDELAVAIRESLCN